MARTRPGGYPIHLNIAGSRCVVVGGGKVALRKAESLLDAGANLVLISPKVPRGLRKTENMHVVRRKYRAADIKGATLVIAATDNKAVNRRVSEDARRRNIPVNVVDQPELCSFIAPASVRRGRLTISVSTGGASPFLAARIRRGIERSYGAEYGHFLDVLAEARAEVLAKVPDPATRRRIFEKMSSPTMLRLLRRKGKRALREAMKKLLT